MSKITVRLHELHLPLKSVFGTGDWQVSARDSIILDLRDSKSGFTGYGESAPLEEFGTERLADARSALREFIGTADFESALELPLEDMMDFTNSLSTTPTARYAVECAILDLRAKREGVPLRIYLGGNGEDDALPVNAVIGNGSVAQAEEAAKRATGENYRCIKIKVGAREIEEDADRVLAVRTAAGNRAFIRIDSNGSWSRKDAERAIYFMEPFGIEYIEQPVAAEDRDGLYGLAAESPIPIAADEAIRTIDNARYLIDSSIQVFILKPMALGGLIETKSLAEEVHAENKKVVFTSLIDSAVGRAATVHLALSLPFGKNTYHGFSTGNMLVDDTAPFQDIRGSMLRIPMGPGIGIHLDLSSKKRK